MQHTNADSRQNQFFQDSRQNDKRPENSSGDEVSVRCVFPDDDIFTNLVKDSVLAQVRDGIRPMFVNNYYVGDNVKSKEGLWAFIHGKSRFSGLQSPLGVTNGNRNHNKPLELI